MKRLFMLFQTLFYTALLTSCAIASQSTTEHRYAEEKTKQSQTTYSERYGKLLDTCIINTGETYSLYRYEQEGGKSFIITKKEKETNSSELPVMQLDDAVNYLFICADENGNILLADTTTLFVFQNEEKEAVQSFQAWAVGGMIITNDSAVICQTFSNSPYYIIDLLSGTKKDVFLKEDFLFEEGNSQPFLYEYDGNKMLITGAGIYEYNKNAWEFRVSADGTSMSKAGFLATRVEKGDNNTYLVYDSDYKYFYSPRETNESTEERQVTLRVTGWQNRDTLRTALTEYQLENPNITIEYIYRCEELPQTKQEANTLLQKTNAEIVSSQAADLYVLDYLPWEKYQKQGILMDLSEIVEPYTKDEEYFGNILTAYAAEDGLYAVPWFFSAKFIICKQELVPYVQNIHKLASYLESHPEDFGLVPFFYRDMPDLFLAMMYDFYGNDLYEDGMLTQESIERFLTSAKIIYDRQ